MDIKLESRYDQEHGMPFEVIQESPSMFHYKVINGREVQVAEEEESDSIHITSVNGQNPKMHQSFHVKMEPEYDKPIVIEGGSNAEQYPESHHSLADVVESFLLSNPDFLDTFVKDHVSLGQIYKWINLKEEPTIEEEMTLIAEGCNWRDLKTPRMTDTTREDVPAASSNSFFVPPHNTQKTVIVHEETTKSMDRSSPTTSNMKVENRTSSAKANRRKLSKPNRITSGTSKNQEENSERRSPDLPGNYFIERCQKCDKTFFSHLSYKLHSCVTKETQALTCNHCESTFRDMTLFTKHVSLKICAKTECKSQFFCSEKFHQHMTSHSNEHPYQCQHCNAVFEDKSRLQSHLQSQHGIRPYQCDRCCKVFTQSGNLKRHIRLHNGERPYKCTICQRAFSDQSHLKYHLKQHSGQKPFRCTQCDKAFLTSTNLRQHAATHLDKHYFCNDCGKEFRTSSDLKRHTEQQHKKTSSQSCTHCGRVFSKPSLLKSHMLDTGNKPYTCKYCSLVLPCAGRIKAHARTHTLESPKYKCPDCEMLFDKGANLKSHLRTHLQFRPFECTECGKCFTQSGNLRRHLRIHSGEKPFKCSECDLAFSDQSHLKYHTIQAHSTVRPFPCSFCGKGFITSSKLKSHMRVHDPQKNGRSKATDAEGASVSDN